MDKPDVDSIEGPVAGDLDRPEDDLAQPAVDRRHGHRDLRLPAPAVGADRPSALPHLRQADRGQSAEQIIDQVMELEEGTRFMVLAPVVRGRKGEYGKALEELRAEGFQRAKVDGELRMLEDEIVLDKKFKHDISVVVDRLVMRGDVRKRLADSIETAVALADGMIEIETVPREGAGEVTLYSEKFACPDHGPVIPELEPRIFSFNSPHGACPRCTGLGSQMEIDPELVVPDPSLSIGEGAIAPWAGSSSQYYEQITQAIAEKYRIDLEAPWRELDDDQRDLFLNGTNGDRIEVSYRNRYGRRRSYATRYEGIIPNLERRYRETDSDLAREKIEEYMSLVPCPACKGRAVEARVAGGACRRRRDPRVHRAERQARARVAGRGRADGDRAPHRAADHARDRRAPALPGQRRDRLPVDGTARRRRCRAARRSGSAWRPRSGRRWWGCCTCSTSRRSACTNATTRSSSPRSSGCATSATP
jgi:excinuclease ABC subunit A